VNEALEAAGPSPEQILLRGERKLQLDGGLAMLTGRERTALLLRDVEDMPAEQVAKQMNCSMATVRSHIANARIKFKRYLEARESS
jgi:RNA polymerase sigma-70 factor (ECF subfamily)